VNKIILATCTIIPFFLSSPAYCSSTIVGHVTGFGAYGNGNVYVSLDQTIDQSGCAVPIIQIPANGAAVKMVSTAAALALALGTTVSVHTDVCFNGAASYSGSSEAFFIVNKP
jgi:hypothetical protein